jgi:glycerol-3-phosphate dehydrogenase (NAD(P)+)
MAIVTVMGAGMMGSALCLPLVDRGHEVRLVGTHLDESIITSLRQDGVHPKLALELPRSIHAFSHTELPAALQGADLLVLGVSSAGVRWAAEQIAPLVADELPVLMVTKGLDWTGSELRVLPDTLAALVHAHSGVTLSPAAIAGPCIAGELARRVDTCVVFTGRSQAVLERAREWVACPYYHVWTSADVVGAEACAALKNAYAMGIAFSIGLHERSGGKPGSIALHNGEAACFAQSVTEMQRLIAALGGDPNTAVGLPGVGDLDVTCNGGRTGRFGRLLGLGLSVPDAIREMQGATLECLEILAVLERALHALDATGKLRSTEMPLLSHMIDVALHGAPVKLPFSRFFGPGDASRLGRPA